MSPIAVYEPLYLPGQQLETAGFLPLRVSNERPEWRELKILVDMYVEGRHRLHNLTGLFSPRFSRKTGLDAQAVFAFIASRPGADVYLFNGAPQSVYVSYNVWTQGECSHPGLTERAQNLLDACGIEWDIAASGRHGQDIACYSNYWVASERFWDAYVGGFLSKIAAFVGNNPNHPATKAVLVETYHTVPTAFLPFIVERLLTTYLSIARPRVEAHLLDPIKTCFNAFERDIIHTIRDRIDRADREKHFPAELVSYMNLLSRLRKRYAMVYYEARPHPHSGEPIPREILAAANAEFDRMPIVKM